MGDLTMGAIESRFAEMIWEREPVSSTELVRLAQQELEWKKSTTYTVLRRLCERGFFQNRDGIVTSLISRQDFYAVRSEQFVEETFSGSLPAFVAAFTSRNSLTTDEIAALQSLIDAQKHKT